MSQQSEVEDALYALGTQLESLDWQPDEFIYIPLRGDHESRSKAIALARTFLRKCHRVMWGALCTNDGRVRTGVKMTPDLISLSTQILASEFTGEHDPSPLAQAIVHINLDAFCSIIPDE